MKCVTKLTTEDPNPDHKILCDVETDHVYNGSSLCTPHVIQAFDRAEQESGFGGLLKGLEKITLDDVVKVSAVMRPLMDAFAFTTRGPMAAPGLGCGKTDGCVLLGGHLGPV